jgi:hypothetical protein
MRILPIVAALPVALAISIGPALTAETDFNTYMMRSYSKLMNPAEHRTKLGYDRASYYTRDLQYGQEPDAIKSYTRVPADPNEKPPAKGSTMCNAAVTETIIEAINLYAKDNPSWSPQQAIPTETWNRSGFTGLKAHLFSHSLFEYEPLKKNNKSEIKKFYPWLEQEIEKFHSEKAMANALEKFGIGQRVEFSKARPGDIISFDRTNDRSDNTHTYGGHSVVFLAYLDRNQDEVAPFDRNKVAGFKYFSSQGGDESGGLGERWAYFKGFCPVREKYKLPLKPLDPKADFRAGCADRIDNDENRAKGPLEKSDRSPTDCCLNKPGDPDGPRVGRLFSPARWTFKSAFPSIRRDYADVQTHIKEFTSKRESALVVAKALAVGAVALEAQGIKQATGFIDKIKSSTKVDLREVARDGADVKMSLTAAREIAAKAPRAVIDAANRRVTTKVQNQIQARIQEAQDSAIPDLRKSEAAGVPNPRLDSATE